MSKSNVLLCQGRYAKTPYFASDDCKNIYCIEELCYYLYHNAYLLDDGFVKKDLAEWIDSELGLSELANDIAKVCSRHDALLRLIEILQSRIGFYSDEEWAGLIDDVGSNNELNTSERRKVRADGFLKERHYGLAMDEYDVILKQTDIREVKLRAGVYHNLGVCAAGLMMFERAAGYFERAYDTYPNAESYVDMLAAMKLYMSSDEYLAYLSDHKETYEDSLEVERRFERADSGWDMSAAGLYLKELETRKRQGKAYYDEIDSLTEEVKEQYRERMKRGKSER